MVNVSENLFVGRGGDGPKMPECATPPANSEPDFAPIYARLANEPSIPAGTVLDGDDVLHRGTGEGWPEDADF